jgi:polyhydroxyalkanoate synthesis regulator phasin
MQDAWRAYLGLALGVTEASRKRAMEATRKLVGQSGATAAQVQAVAEELLSAGLANREALTKIVRFEVDRALGAVGLATADEVAELTARVRQLERELREAGREAPAATAPAGGSRAAAPETVGTKAVAKKAVKKAAVKKATGAAPQAAPTGRTVPEPGTAAKKIVAKKLPRPAKKSAPKKLPPARGTGLA